MNTFLTYSPVQLVTLLLLVVLIFWQHRKGQILSRKWAIIALSVALVVLALLYRTYMQWELFAAGPPSQFLLPPHAPWSYFLHYSWSWIWSSYLLALFGAATLFCSISLAPKAWRDIRFEEHEPLLLSLGLFFVGHPYWIFYFAGVLILYLLYAAIRAWHFPTSQRVSFYYFWLPAALIVVLLTPLLKTLPILQMLTITL